MTQTGRILSLTSPPVPPLYFQDVPAVVAIVGNAAPMTDMVGAEDHSWQDVYTSYGCSLEFDVSDDDG